MIVFRFFRPLFHSLATRAPERRRHGRLLIHSDGPRWGRDFKMPFSGDAADGRGFRRCYGRAHTLSPAPCMAEGHADYSTPSLSKLLIMFLVLEVNTP